MGGNRKITRELEVRNRLGIHARPAAMLVKTAANYESEITITHAENSVSAKSIMGVLTLEGYQGARFQLVVEGPDAEDAVAAVEELFANGFYED
ncbi:HPr family phosphocarrier protein [Kiritimatiella glycovorans]|uniref:Phosphocarrier protein HPr n=1 Tax=Kiritimatiella glycovorans TaxID=1307763 RepID=A0A0G3ECN0_9BACT|nr:HPr family phosphocarrier protein [Kiritimatiella glycovorans]AKJ64058.1 Phosphocarrier protein HPr [Kiritimatiella glycovorans]